MKAPVEADVQYWQTTSVCSSQPASSRARDARSGACDRKRLACRLRAQAQAGDDSCSHTDKGGWLSAGLERDGTLDGQLIEWVFMEVLGLVP